MDILKFKNKVLIIGCGSVGKCVLPVLLKHVDIPLKNITVVDFADKREVLKNWIARGLKYSQERITPVNITKVLAKHVSAGGLLIDLSWNIDCLDILTWCHDNKVLYVNTSVEEWDPYAAVHQKSPFKKSLYYKQMEIRGMVARWNNGHMTAVLDHGANPGLISHFVKKGLVDIARKAIGDKTTPRKQANAISRVLKEKDFARLSMSLGVKVIHCSERDTQLTNKIGRASCRERVYGLV